MHVEQFIRKVEERTAIVGVMGLGYVGLPLAIETAQAGFRTIGFDLDPEVVRGVSRGESHIRDVPRETVFHSLRDGMLSVTGDFSRLHECDAILICVPTPLNKIKDPDLSYVHSATEAIRQNLRPGQLVVLESTTYPGTTRDVLLPLLEMSGLRVGDDFFLCFSPERVDPGNPLWHTKNTPKVLGGTSPSCSTAGMTLYRQVFDVMVPVRSTEAAEMVKVYENTFRMINIALANELAQACDKLGVDVWEVLDAAATKPFGFMKFLPGPGLGGHCIPLDPHYLSWKMRSLAYKTRLIDLASEINGEMPKFVVQKTVDALNEEGKPLRDSRVLIVGIAYKKDVDDLRESPALEIIRLLEERNAQVFYHDPLCPELESDNRSNVDRRSMKSVELSDCVLAAMDVVVIVTDHTAISFRRIMEHAALVIDTRGALRGIQGRARVVGLSGRHQTVDEPSALDPFAAAFTHPAPDEATAPIQAAVALVRG